MRAAILDIDGTLVDTNYQHALAWYRAFRRHQIVLPLWRIHRSIGMGGGQLVAALAGEEVEAELGEAVRDEENPIYMEMIAEVEATKPNPDLVEAALERAGTRDAVLVGDSVWDCVAADRAGIAAVGVLTGAYSREELAGSGAAAVFDSIEELRGDLGALDAAAGGRRGSA